MKSLLGLSLTVLLLLGVFFTPTAAAGDIIKVMTQNQYLGADLTPLIEAAVGGSLKDFIAAVEDAFTQIAINNFPLRAQRLATEVALSNPDAIALQEVIDLKLNGENPGPPYVDHLTETLDALAAKGLYYVVAAKVINLNITMPIGPSDINGDLVSIVDRDVILVREGVAFTALSGYYDPNEPTLGPLCGVPVSNPVPVLPFPPTLESTVSEDGCNYTAVAEFKSPLIGKITINRGFVGVDVTVRGKDYRVVNTHLEVRELLSVAKFSWIFQ